VAAAVWVVHLLNLSRLQLDLHATRTHVARVDAAGAAGRHRAVISRPSGMAVALHASTLLILKSIHMGGLRIRTLALARAVVGAVGHTAVVSAEARVTPARAVVAFAVGAVAVVGAGWERTVITRVCGIAVAFGIGHVTFTVAAAVVGAGHLGAVIAHKSRLAVAHSVGGVAHTLSRAVSWAHDLLTRLPTETLLAVARGVGAVPAVVAVVLAACIGAVLTNVVLCALALASVALAVGVCAVVGALLDGAICSLPAAVASTCAVVAVTVAVAVVEADAEVAVERIPPMLTLANTSGNVALAVARAIIRARMIRTILIQPSVRAFTLAGITMAQTIAVAVIGAQQL